MTTNMICIRLVSAWMLVCYLVGSTEAQLSATGMPNHTSPCPDGACANSTDETLSTTPETSTTPSSLHVTSKRICQKAGSLDLGLMIGLLLAAAVLSFIVVSLCILVVKRRRQLASEGKTAKDGLQNDVYEELDKYAPGKSGDRNADAPYTRLGATVGDKTDQGGNAEVYEALDELTKEPSSSSPPPLPPPPDNGTYEEPDRRCKATSTFKPQESKKAKEDMNAGVDEPRTTAATMKQDEYDDVDADVYPVLKHEYHQRMGTDESIDAYEAQKTTTTMTQEAYEAVDALQDPVLKHDYEKPGKREYIDVSTTQEGYEAVHMYEDSEDVLKHDYEKPGKGGQ